MTSDQQKKLDMYEARDTKRKQQVKEYFARRKAKEAFYKEYFEKNAKKEEKQQLVNIIANL